MAYNQDNNGEQVTNPALAMNGIMVKKIRITALKGTWDDKPPYIEGKRNAINVIFNTQGPSPFLLVWGNYHANAESMNYRELIGQPLTVNELMSRYPE